MRDKTLTGLLLFFSLGVLSGPGSTAAAGTWVTIGKDSTRAYLALPEGKGPHPALMVFHEWWGLVDWIQQTTDELAKKGYVSCAVDLYGGQTASTPDQAMDLMRKVPQENARRIIREAHAYLGSRPDVQKAKIGSIGWCMGGGYSMIAAEELPTLAAAVVCYGRLATRPEDIRKIPCPMLCIFGGKDQAYPADTLKVFQAAAAKLKKQVSARVYPEASHAFMNPNNKQGFRKADAADAWSRIDAFLDGKLKKRS